MSLLLAVDAGGTSTRAVVLDHAGRALGYGRAGAGNPTAAGTSEAVAAIGEASELAMRGAGSGRGRSTAVIALAGEKTPVFREQLSTRLSQLGWARVVLQHDLLGIFHSGTPLPEGYVLIAGTGTVAARVAGGRLERVVGGRGWLLGDAGGGFWIGHRVARAVVASLDGQAPPTALCGLLTDAAAVSADLSTAAGRATAARQLVSKLYSRPPVSLAGFAPLAFAAREDPVAREILVAASKALADLVAAVRVPTLAGPLVVGGSVAVRGLLAAPADLQRDLTPLAVGVEPIRVPDGLVGAVVMALRQEGTTVDAARFAAVRDDVERLAART